MSLPWTNEATFEGLLNHAKVYENQIKNPTFKSTTKDFKEGQIRSFVKHIERTAEKVQDTFYPDASINMVNKMINDFNKGDGKDYGYSLSIRYISHDIIAVDVTKTTK